MSRAGAPGSVSGQAASPPPRTSRIHVGGVPRDALRQALRDAGVQLNEAGEALFADARFTTLAERHPVEIVEVTVAELGFPDGATYDALVERAAERGLVECPLELGPHLRLQRMDQPEGVGAPTPSSAPPGSLTIASRALDASEETPRGFYLRRVDGTAWLRGYRSWPGHSWSPADVLVFAVSRSE